MYQLKYNQEDVPPLVLKFNVTVYKTSCWFFKDVKGKKLVFIWLIKEWELL